MDKIRGQSKFYYLYYVIARTIQMASRATIYNEATAAATSARTCLIWIIGLVCPWASSHARATPSKRQGLKKDIQLFFSFLPIVPHELLTVTPVVPAEHEPHCSYVAQAGSQHSEGVPRRQSRVHEARGSEQIHVLPLQVNFGEGSTVVCRKSK